MSIEQTQNKHPKLHKFLADSGLCSRRQGEILISSGSVTVNGQKPKLGERIDPFKDVIKLNGKKFSQKILHKRHLWLTSLRDLLAQIMTNTQIS